MKKIYKYLGLDIGVGALATITSQHTSIKSLEERTDYSAIVLIFHVLGLGSRRGVIGGGVDLGRRSPLVASCWIDAAQCTVGAAFVALLPTARRRGAV